MGRYRGIPRGGYEWLTQRSKDAKKTKVCCVAMGDEVGERWLFEVSRSLQFGVGVVVTRGVVGFVVGG